MSIEPSKWAGLGAAARIAASTVLRAMAASRDATVVMAKQMYEDESGETWDALDRKAQREWLFRSRSAIVGLNAFLFAKDPTG